jgi:hypothetical protein
VEHKHSNAERIRAGTRLNVRNWQFAPKARIISSFEEGEVKVIGDEPANRAVIHDLDVIELVVENFRVGAFEVLVGPLDVGGGKRRPILELQALAQSEGNLLVVRGLLGVFGSARYSPMQISSRGSSGCDGSDAANSA